MKIVAFGAHYDDVEIGCGGTLLKHADLGDDISIVTVTSSDYCTQDNSFSRSAQEARKEAEAAAGFIGAELIALDKEPLNLSHTEKLVHEIDQLLRTLKPDLVLTHWGGDFHSDHAAVSLSTVRAARYVDRILLYRSTWFFTEQTFKPNYLVDISGYLERKKELISFYQSVLKRVDFTWIDFIEQQNKADGLKINSKAAESFNCIKYVDK